MNGLDAHRGTLYLAAGKEGHEFVASVDIKTGKVLRMNPVPAPGRLKAVSDELLYVVSRGTTVLALNPRTGGSRAVISRLSGAASITTDAAGDIYVGVNGADVQVKVFDKAGKFLRAIGKKGGRPLLGPWQGDGMIAIAGITVDPKGQLWVAEETSHPPRFAVWNAHSGLLIKELFGPTHYGASGGAIHPADPNVMVGDGCEWHLDPATGQTSCTGVFDANGGGFWAATALPSSAMLPTAGITWRRSFRAISPFASACARQVCCSHDDQLGSRQETHDFLGGRERRRPGPAQRSDDVAAGTGTGRILLLVGTHEYRHDALWRRRRAADCRFTACGAPKYDPAAFKTSELPPGVPSLDNKFLLACGVEQFPTYRCYDVATGKPLWDYPNEFAGVHGSHEAPPPAVGMIRGAFGPIGAAKVPTVGHLWAINSNVGEWHILTQDGYYLTRLFQGDPLKLEFPAQAVPGAVIDNVPCGMGGEDFGGSLVQAADGKIYIEAGKCAFWNCQLVGFAGIKPLAAVSFIMTAEDTKKAEHFRELALQEVSRGKRAQVKNATIRFSGDLAKDFAGVELFAYKKQDDASVRSALAWDAEYLYAAWDVADKTPWVNGASDPAQMYLSGDTVDLQLGLDSAAGKDRSGPVAGDLRVSIGNWQGAATAVIYRKVAPVKRPKHFSSGVVRDYVMDYVDVLPKAKVSVKVRPQAGYMVEAAIPWADLGLAPKAGLAVRGDVGVTHGDLAGQRTRLRTYWSNHATGIVDDAVYELMMEPKNWGTLEFTGK